jgi:hypothetical protein
MQAPTEVPSPPAEGRVPTWVRWTLLIGAGILILWAWFISGFFSEPSAVGRPRVVLGVVAGGSLGTAALGITAAVGLVRRARWAPRLALVAAGFMILTVVGAIAGIPAAVALASNWRSART